jgi:hypothetical protein
MSEEPTGQGDSATSIHLERRAWVRYAADLQAACHLAGGMRDAGWPGMVHDISAGGIALLLRHRFKPGTTLAVDLKSASGQYLRTVRARVIYAVPTTVQGDHWWRVGCVLVNTLQDDELQALL